MKAERTNQTSILEVDGLSVKFSTRDGIVNAVRDVSFQLFSGESLGIVGESGCGKSVTALSILRLIPCPPRDIKANRLAFNGVDLLLSSEKQMRQICEGAVG